jgi:DNA repair exonuclease SbcCD ATPase subunit
MAVNLSNSDKALMSLSKPLLLSIPTAMVGLWGGLGLPLGGNGKDRAPAILAEAILEPFALDSSSDAWQAELEKRIQQRDILAKKAETLENQRADAERIQAGIEAAKDNLTAMTQTLSGIQKENLGSERKRLQEIQLWVEAANALLVKIGTRQSVDRQPLDSLAKDLSESLKDLSDAKTFEEQKIARNKLAEGTTGFNSALDGVIAGLKAAQAELQTEIQTLLDKAPASPEGQPPPP